MGHGEKAEAEKKGFKCCSVKGDANEGQGSSRKTKNVLVWIDSEDKASMI